MMGSEEASCLEVNVCVDTLGTSARLAAGPLSDAFHVGQSVQGGLVALGAPDGFAEAFEHVVQGGVAVAALGLALFEGFADAGRLVDGELLLDGKVQREMQEGIDLPVFGAELLVDAVRIVDQRVVFRMVGNEVGSDDFELGLDFAVLVLAPGFDEEPAGLVSGWIEHDDFRRSCRG